MGTEPLRWVDEPAEMSCPVCGHNGAAARIAMAQWGEGEVGVVRCPTCGCVVPEVVGTNSEMPHDAFEDSVEFNASIDAVLTTLAPVAVRPDLHFLDVGCGYGFALDVTRFAWGWRGVGVDPSSVADRGGTDLGVEIVAERLDASLDLGDEPFNVALASEALEHVPEPVAFLREIHRRLRPDGVLVLSTPNAEFVRPVNSTRDAAGILDVGGHYFLATAAGLEILLRRAGYDAVVINQDPQSLRAVASPTMAGLAHCVEPRPLDLALLARYCKERAVSARHGSALHLGMCSRHVQYALHANDLSAAEAGLTPLREAMTERYGFDLEHPAATSARTERSEALPSVLASAHYSIGFVELMKRERPARAAEHFAAAAAVVKVVMEERQEPGLARIRLRAIGHEALAYARADPSRTPALLHRLRDVSRELIGPDLPEIDALCASVFRELVARARFEEADAVRMLVPLPEAWIREEHAFARGRAELDTVFSLGMLAFHRGRAAEAMAYFGLCARLAESVGAADARELARTARLHEALALDGLEVDTGIEERAPVTSDDPVFSAGTLAPQPPIPETSSVRLGVCVIIPLFNGARHLREAVQSVIDQTAPPNELIVVDDGSTDDGWRVIDDLVAPFPIQIIHQVRAGQSAARNRGAASTEAELLAFLDQDDVWHPEHLEAMCAPFATDPNAGWVYSDFNEIDAEGRTVMLAFMVEHGVAHPRTSLTACLSEDLMVIPSASVMRASMFDALGGFDPLLQGYEDDDLYVRAFRAGWRLAFEPRPLTRFRVHAGSSSSEERFIESRRYFSRKLRETVADDRRLNRYYSRDVIAPRFLKSCFNDFVRALSDKDWDAARKLRRDLKYFGMLHRDRSSLRWKLWLTRSPRLFRWMLRAFGSMPFRSRRVENAAYRLR
jgi:glycosyltransferase involved in cell wall biosynthesis/SAM-dependent methyltransferase